MTSTLMPGGQRRGNTFETRSGRSPHDQRSRKSPTPSSMTAGSMKGLSPLIRTSASRRAVSASARQRPATSSAAPRKTVTPSALPKEATGSSTLRSDVARKTGRVGVTRRALASTWPSIGRPAMSASTFPGNRRESNRAKTAIPTLASGPVTIDRPSVVATDDLLPLLDVPLTILPIALLQRPLRLEPETLFGLLRGERPPDRPVA